MRWNRRLAKSLRHAAVPACLLLAVMPAPAHSDEETAAAAERTVVIGPQYKSGPLHRWLWGSDYRDLYTTPTRVEVLDLHTFAGGLVPVLRVGGRETKALAFRGADGRDYTFRGIDKDPTSILPEDLRDTWVRGLVQDQIAASHPASSFVVDDLMKAAGILRTDQRLVVMPDDPSLGEFRKEFAGVVGQLFEFPGARSERNPGFQAAVEIVKHAELYERLAADPRERVDARAFLEARLFDLMIGDWDRHRDQWRWAKFSKGGAWQPLPDDRDQAFSRYEGLVLTLARRRVPILQNYGGEYPGMTGLTWNGWEQDRQLLAGLDRAAFKAVAAELRSEITDEVIATAVRRMPSGFLDVDGDRLARDLTARRDGLGEAAEAFYAHLADKVKVYLTDTAEYVEVKRLDGGATLVQVWMQSADGTRVGEPFYRRTFDQGETSEVQIYLRAGKDKVVTLGRPRGATVRVIGGSGEAVVDDTAGGGTRLSDAGRGELRSGPGSRLDRRLYAAPAPPQNAPWIPPRDWGRDTFFVPWLSYGSDIGALVGGGIDTRGFGFRKDPYANRHVVRAAWAFGESTYRADYRAEFRSENRSWYLGWYAYASGIETSRFFGFGNETSDGGDPSSDFFKAKQKQYSFTPLVAIPLSSRFTFFVGPTVKYGSDTHKSDSTLLNLEQPYGYGDFGAVGASGLLDLDTRDAAKAPGGVALRNFGYPRRGAHVQVRGRVWPKAWDVEETFGSVKGNAAVYLSPRSEKAPTLALRAGGEKVFGAYPYFEAAYIGGGAIGAASGDEPLRGLKQHRYAGDASLYGSADLRLYVSRFRILLPGTWGLLGFGDVGRVYLKGEDSNKWHTGFGGGLWFAWLDRSNAVSVSFARSEGENALYLKAGFAF